MAEGIKDKVVILGMGCSRFGERWDDGSEELADGFADLSACRVDQRARISDEGVEALHHAQQAHRAEHLDGNGRSECGASLLGIADDLQPCHHLLLW